MFVDLETCSSAWSPSKPFDTILSLYLVLQVNSELLRLVPEVPQGPASCLLVYRDGDLKDFLPSGLDLRE